MIEIYADGAYNPVLGQGGWGAVIVEDGQKRVFSGAVKGTTSNRMEITAALEGIRRTPQAAEVVVYTDSQYLFGCMTRGWQRRANRDLWGSLDEAVSQRKVSWQWTRGDVGNQFQKEAHVLATSLASQGEMVRPVPSEKQKEQPKAPIVEELTHVSSSGEARMVNISQKGDTEREAVARGRVIMKPTTLGQIRANSLKKGDVLAVARVAGIMAAKKTPELIPLCHPILISDIAIDFDLSEDDAIGITARVKSTGKTGVEMEALVATSVAALTIYDMAKSVDKGMTIGEIYLESKTGGKSGAYRRKEEE